MTDKYLLYIDFLGFSELVKNNPNEIEKLYNLINSLAVHKHNAFKTIIFSDTILVYNKIDPKDQHEHEYLVMFACEFVSDLLYRLTDKDIYFRAILTYGNFKHYNLENVECFYGQSLIDCYTKEKTIVGVGLFIDKKIQKHNLYFKTTSYDKDFDFVYLFSCLERLNNNTGGILPTTDLIVISETDEYWAIKFELKTLKNIYYYSVNHQDPKVRSKYLQTYQFYRNRYNELLICFESNDFKPSTINNTYNWSLKLESY